MKKIYCILLIMTTSFIFTYGESQPPLGAPSKKMKEEMRERKKIFIDQVVNFRGNEETKFLQAYKIYNRKKDNAHKACMEQMKKIENGQSRDYELFNELKIREKNIVSDAYSEYIASLRKFLSEEKIFKIELAETKFKKMLLDDMRKGKCRMPPPPPQ